MADEPQVVEKKLGMSLDELIAEQKKKQGTKPAAGGKKKGVKAVRDEGWGFDLHRPRRRCRSNDAHTLIFSCLLLFLRSGAQPKVAAGCWWSRDPRMCPDLALRQQH